mgnify:CR=1 FL=1
MYIASKHEQIYLVNIYDAPKTKPVFQEAPTFIEPLPLKKLPVVSQPGLVPYVLPKQSTVKSTPIYQASQAHRTGQYQIGNNVWNEDKKKWERKLFKDSEERDWYYNQGKIKKQHGGLTKYQGDKEPSEVNTSDVVPNTTPAYERVVVTDPNDPNYLEYQKLKRLYDWSNLDTDYKNDTLWRYLSLDEENKISFKVPKETYEELIQENGIHPAPYLWKNTWVRVDHSGIFKTSEWQAHILTSYKLIKANLLKRDQFDFD